MDKSAAEQMSRSLKAVSDVNRIRILGILVGGEHCVSDLVDQLQVDQPKVSHHLAILRQAGIIRSRRQGRHINYSLRPEVHQRLESTRGPMDVLDLEGLLVSFRFAVANGGVPAPALDGHRVQDRARVLDPDGATARVRAADGSAV
jgi:ArsR family transcriptional regulator